MIVTLQLIIAHLLADFVFQSNKIIRQKERGVYGHINHAVIVCFWTAIFLFPYWGTLLGWTAVFTISITHFLQDYLKVAFEKEFNREKKLYPFFLDQALHLSLILYFGLKLSDTEALNRIFVVIKELYFNEEIASFAIIFILLSFTADVLIFQVKRRKKKSLTYHRDYKAMVMRLLAFLVLYLALITLTSSGAGKF